MKKKIDDLDFALTRGREEYNISRAVFLRLLDIVSEIIKDEKALSCREEDKNR